MDQTHTFSLNPAVPVWHDPTVARKLIRTTLDDFADRALQSLLGSAPPPALALAVSAGLGKTGTTLQVLADRGADLLEHGHVMFYVPTLKLAEEVAGDFGRLAPHLPHMVFRGRLAIDPVAPRPRGDEDPTRMCLRHDLVETISGVVGSVTESLCRARDPLGNFYQAPCAETCGYMRQLRHPGHRVVFLSHSYLTVPNPLPEPVSLRVVDEKIWSSLVSSPLVPVEEWLMPSRTELPDDLAAAHRRTRFGLLSALEEGKPILDALRDDGLTPETLRELARLEEASTPELLIRPWDTDSRQNKLATAFPREEWSRGRMKAGIFRHLAASFHRPTTERLSLATVTVEKSQRRVIRLHGCGEMSTDQPLLMLDADADDRIMKRICPSAEIVRIESKPQADIVQITDATMSTSYLLHPEKGTGRRAPLLQVIRQEVEASGGVGCLVVATQDVLTALEKDVGPLAKPKGGKASERPLLGAAARWFGPSMQGVNDYQNFGTVVIIGRLQPPIDAVEDNMRCLFGDGEGPLQFAPDGLLSKVVASRLMSDDRLEPAIIQSHPDPRGAVVLAQMRECMSLQAIARLRLIAPAVPKRVVLLGNLVLPGLPISRLTTLRALCDGLAAEDDVRAYQRLAAALGDGREPTAVGLRLSAAGLKEDLPSAFVADGSSKNFRRGRETDWLLGVIRRIAEARGWSWTRVDLAAPTGGRAIPAVVFVDRMAAEAEVRRHWPGLRLRKVL